MFLLVSHLVTGFVTLTLDYRLKKPVFAEFKCRIVIHLLAQLVRAIGHDVYFGDHRRKCFDHYASVNIVDDRIDFERLSQIVGHFLGIHNAPDGVEFTFGQTLEEGKF